MDFGFIDSGYTSISLPFNIERLDNVKSTLSES